MASGTVQVPMVLTSPDSRKVQVKSGHLNVSSDTQNGRYMCTMEENQSMKCTESRFSDVYEFINFLKNYLLWLYCSKKFNFHTQFCMCTFICVFLVIKRAPPFFRFHKTWLRCWVLIKVPGPHRKRLNNNNSRSTNKKSTNEKYS